MNHHHLGNHCISLAIKVNIYNKLMLELKHNNNAASFGLKLEVYQDAKEAKEEDDDD